MKRRTFGWLAITKAGAKAEYVGIFRKGVGHDRPWQWLESFTPVQARKLAACILKMADEIDGAKPWA